MYSQAGRMMMGGVLLALALAMDGPAVSAEDGWLAGMVCAVDQSPGYQAAGAPIAGATVSVVGGAQATTTAGDGSYNLSLPEGSYSLRVTKTGFHDATSFPAYVAQNCTTALDVLLWGPNGNLTGRVIDENGNPVNGARVAWRELAMFTQMDGMYTLTGLPVGTLPINVTANLALTYHFNATILEDRNVTMDLRLDFNQTVPSPLEVKVVDEDGRPIMGAKVLFGMKSNKTGGDGVAVLDGITPGTNRTLTVTARGYESHNQNLTVEKGGTSVRVMLCYQTKNKPREDASPGYEALPVLAVAALAALAVRKRRRA